MMEPMDVRKLDIKIPEELPILPSGDEVLYPLMLAPIGTADERIKKLIEESVARDKIIGVFPSKGEDISDVGTAAVIIRMMRMPDNSIRAFLQGVKRLKLIYIIEREPYIRGRVEVMEDVGKEGVEVEALKRNLVSLFQKVVSLAPNLPNEFGVIALNIEDPGNLADFVAANLNLNPEEKKEVLSLSDVGERLRKVTQYINREIEILELGMKIQSQIKGEMDRAQREYFLREQLKAIQRELGEYDERTMEINELKAKIEEAGLPPEVKKEAEREIDRLSRMPPQAAEYTVSRTYLDWLINLPWNKMTEDNFDIERARRILDEDHYNLEKVKERILEYLAVGKMKGGDIRGPILCFVGPPGTGKTSMGQSIARALGRKFVRISLGGVRDEAEIRGHRRTYVGALPGRIIQGIRRAGSKNPVFMLDEVDKIGADFRGDPSAALLEVLDPEQNHSFYDHYLDVPFDLSKVLFITTANITDTIPPALLDRMEVIELPGYTELEKLEIAKRHLIPRLLKETGLPEERVKIKDEAILGIIRNYTSEAGLRNLEREIGSILRKIAMRIAEGADGVFEVDARDLEEYLGPPKYKKGILGDEDEVGVAVALAWTPTGGDVMPVEVSIVPGKGECILTGRLGEVMQESAKAAITYARGKDLGIDPKIFETRDIHIHVPAGAIPKDGPSAGITIAVALISALTGRKVRKDTGMTGEITLRGRILPVGGIREKVMAAHRAGLKKVILPKDNEKDLRDVPEEVKREMEFLFVKNADEVLEEVLYGS